MSCLCETLESYKLHCMLLMMYLIYFSGGGSTTVAAVHDGYVLQKVILVNIKCS